MLVAASCESWKLWGLGLSPPWWNHRFCVSPKLLNHYLLIRRKHIQDLGNCFSFSPRVYNFYFGSWNILVFWDSEKIITTHPVETVQVVTLLGSSKVKVLLMESIFLQLIDWKQPEEVPVIRKCNRVLNEKDFQISMTMFWTHLKSTVLQGKDSVSSQQGLTVFMPFWKSLHW